MKTNERIFSKLGERVSGHSLSNNLNIIAVKKMLVDLKHSLVVDNAIDDVCKLKGLV